MKIKHNNYLFMRFNRPLPCYKPKEFKKKLEELGFKYHHSNSAHDIYANNEYYYVTVPKGKKEINAMMTTVTLQRIKNKQLRKLDVKTIGKYEKCK